MFLISLHACLFIITNIIAVERRTPEREVGGSILTQVALLYPWVRYSYHTKSTGNTQEAVVPSRHDYKIVEWDVKPQPKPNHNKHYCKNHSLKILLFHK